MEELNSLFNDKLKVSALNKSKTISKYVRSVTIGPNADPNDRTNLNITIFNKDNDSRNVTKPQRRNNYTEDVVSKRIFVEAENLRRNEVVVRKLPHVSGYNQSRLFPRHSRLFLPITLCTRNELRRVQRTLSSLFFHRLPSSLFIFSVQSLVFQVKNIVLQCQELFILFRVQLKNGSDYIKNKNV